MVRTFSSLYFSTSTSRMPIVDAVTRVNTSSMASVPCSRAISWGSMCWASSAKASAPASSRTCSNSSVSSAAMCSGVSPRLVGMDTCDLSCSSRVFTASSWLQMMPQCRAGSDTERRPYSPDPASSSCLMTPMCPANTACCSGVYPRRSPIERFARRSSKRWTMSPDPLRAAMCSAVSLATLTASTRAAARRSALTTVAWPLAAAKWRGVLSRASRAAQLRAACILSDLTSSGTSPLMAATTVSLSPSAITRPRVMTRVRSV
mmetsp:Transcript_1749/g.3936  ORF Transcript_1749/g.3936 Transcript_1749/m.3936 type:complete len:262 (-) Transcript_1749:18-803(-)